MSTTPSKALTIRDHLNSPAILQEIARVVPQHMKPERMVRVALTALMRTPDLATCEQASFFKALLDLSAWGLEPDGRHAHLIPFRNNKRGVMEVQLIIDYKGYVKLAYQSGHVKSIHADVVRRGDAFAYNMGEVVMHTPWFLRPEEDRPEEAGEIFAVYCRVQLADGVSKTEVLSLDEVEGIRKRSKAKDRGPWVTDYIEMAKKTAFRRITKWIPLSAELRDAMDRDDDRFEDLVQVRQPSQQAGMAGLKSQLGEMLERQAEPEAIESQPEQTLADPAEPTEEELVANGLFDRGAEAPN